MSVMSRRGKEQNKRITKPETASSYTSRTNGHKQEEVRLIQNNRHGAPHAKSTTKHKHAADYQRTLCFAKSMHEHNERGLPGYNLIMLRLVLATKIRNFVHKLTASRQPAL